MTPRLLAMLMAVLLLSACAIKPEPITPEARADARKDDRLAMFSHQQPLEGPLSLEQAMARALAYNLEHRVKLLEEAASQRQLDLSHFNLLPRLPFSQNRTIRDRPEATNSFSITTDSPSSAFSTSQDEGKKSGNISLVWNFLDFGVSYYQARQEADQVLVAAERRRQVIHGLMKEVRASFWQAAAAQRVEENIGPLIEQARSALKDARQVEDEGLKPPMEMLQYQRALLDVVRQLEEMRDDLSMARERLWELINLPPGRTLTLDLPAEEGLILPDVPQDITALEETALDLRPEIREQLYEARISAQETQKAMLRLLPGLELSMGRHWDDNSFTLHNRWQEVGYQVTWNLLDLLAGPTAIQLSKNREELTRMRRLALNMAIMTQVRLSFLQYEKSRRQLHNARLMNAIDQRIREKTAAQTSQMAQNALEEIRARTNAITSRLRLHQVFAQGQNALGELYRALGLDPLPETLNSHDLAAIEEALQGHFRLPDYDPPPVVASRAPMATPFLVQVGAFTQEAVARDMARHFGEKGYAVTLNRPPAAQWFKLYLGPFPDDQQAQAARERFQSQEDRDAFVVAAVPERAP